jgi:ATP-dependent DNA ligase
VRPGPAGRPMFCERMRRRGPFCFYAFDLLWLDGRDLRDLALSERKGCFGNCCRGARHGRSCTSSMPPTARICSA